MSYYDEIVSANDQIAKLKDEIYLVSRRALEEAVKLYLKDLKAQYPNHTFKYCDDMGSRTISVINKAGVDKFTCHPDGGWISNRSNKANWRWYKLELRSDIEEFLAEVDHLGYVGKFEY